MNTLAQVWQDFADQTYRGRLQHEHAREYRMLYSAGFKACIEIMAELGRSGLSADEMTARVEAYLCEYHAFALDYISERQREQ